MSQAERGEDEVCFPNGSGSSEQQNGPSVPTAAVFQRAFCTPQQFRGQKEVNGIQSAFRSIELPHWEWDSAPYGQ